MKGADEVTTGRRRRGGRGPLVVDGAVALAFFAISTPLPLATHRPGLALLLLVLTAPLVVRRRHPVPVFAVVSLAAFVQWLTVVQLGLYDGALLISLYTVAAYTSRRWSIPALGVGLVGGSLAWWTVHTGRGVQLGGLVAPTVVVLAVWIGGRTMRTRRRYLAELEERAGRLERERDALARAAVAEERARIAREMHDVVAHTVAVMVAQAEGASVVVRSAPERAEHALEVISDAGRSALGELRRMLGVLRDQPPTDDPPTQAPAAPQTAPQPGLTDLEPLVRSVRASGLPVRYVREGADAPVDPTLALAVYRIVQESLTNTLKHAGPGTPTQLTYRRTTREIELEVLDHGPRGDRPPPASTTGGHGVTGMRERVAVFGGDFSALPTPSGGWRVRAILPVVPACTSTPS
jgi:signal transduction histidine kinase